MASCELVAASSRRRRWNEPEKQRSHPGWDKDGATERQAAVVASHYIKTPFDVGAW